MIRSKISRPEVDQRVADIGHLDDPEAKALEATNAPAPPARDQRSGGV